jgi:hypothetical protein
MPVLLRTQSKDGQWAALVTNDDLLDSDDTLEEEEEGNMIKANKLRLDSIFVFSFLFCLSLC